MTPAAAERAQVRWPMLLLCAAVWLCLIVAPDAAGLHAHHGGGMAGRGAASLGMMLKHNPPGRLALGWLLMLVAMMGPLLIEPIRHIRDRSFARRRARAIALFVSGYVIIWLLVGAVMLPLVFLVKTMAGNSPGPLALSVVVAMLWHGSPLKQVCLNRGHAHWTLPAFGRAADLSALKFGWVHGCWCVGSCWAVMLASLMLAKGHLPGMAAVTMLLIVERFERPQPPRWGWRVPGKAARVVIARTLWRRSPVKSARPFATAA